MRIGIDARFYGSVGKGLGRYTEKLIKYLEIIDSENQYFIFLRRKNWNEYEPKNKNFKKIMADIPWYGFREQLFFPRMLNKYSLDLVHFPHFNVPFLFGRKFVVTIHDLILFHFPTKRASALSPMLYWIKNACYRWAISRAIRKSESIIAVSEFTKRDILENFSVDPDKIIVTYQAADKEQALIAQPADEILKKYGIIKPYLLYVGNAYPHKNLESLVAAFREVLKRHPGLHLVMVGKEDYFYRRLKESVSSQKIKNVIFPDYVSDSDLSAVYRGAKLYVFPSLYEGFGLPPLEAMAKSIPVVSSNASCLPEILENAAYYFDPRGTAGMADSIEKTLTDNGLRKELIEAGRARIKKFSWEKLAGKTLEIYLKQK
ncbi:MAG: glycosyltransferase family 1 protein [Parcubacteria group bacterium]|jgi:glycosyltransferase involved in cell wall biosynthesis